MPREIKTTLAVDGEAAFKRSINEANTSIKNLGTQLTLAQAEFKKDGDAMKLMETRSKALNAEIDQQKEIVKALEKAVEDSTKAYGANSAKTEKWQAELNRAQAKLVGLESELSNNEAGLDRNGKAFDEGAQKAQEYGEALKGIGKNLSLETLSSGVEAITGTIENAIGKVVELAGKIKDLMKESAQWADELTTEAMINNLSVEDQQRYEYASNFVDTSVDTIMTARDRVIKKMVNGWTGEENGEKVDMWDFLGIDIKDATTGGYRDSLDVLFDIGETLKSIEKVDGNDIRANAWAMEVLGKSYKELRPLFNAGKDEFLSRMAEAPIVSEENVKKLNELNDEFDKFDAQLEKLKNTAMAELAPALQGIVETLSGMLEEFNKWLETDEGKQAMQELSEAIKELFSGLKDVDFSVAINAAKDAINALKDGLQWLAENRGAVYDALKYIAGGFALLKVSEGVLAFLKLKAGWNLATGKGLGGSSGNQMDITNAGRPGGTYTTPTTLPTTDGGSISTEGIDFGMPVMSGFGKILNSLTLVGLASAWKEAWDNSPGALKLKEVEEITAGMSEAERDKYVTQEAFGMSDEEYEKYRESREKDRFMGSAAESGGHGFYVPADYKDPTEADRLQRIGEEMTQSQREAAEAWWDEYRKDPMGDQWDEAWAKLEESFSGNADLLERLDDAFNDWQTSQEDNEFLDQENLFENSTEDLQNAADMLKEATTELKTNTEAAKVVTEKAAGVDLKTFNALPPEMQKAVAAGAAAGVSGIRVTLDGAAVGRMIAPYVSSLIAAQIGR